jgi:hypothetical protein
VKFINRIQVLIAQAGITYAICALHLLQVAPGDIRGMSAMFV